jgi:hypothetical protein
MKYILIITSIFLLSSCRTQKCKLNSDLERKFYEYDLSNNSGYKITEDVRVKAVSRKFCEDINNSDSFLLILTGTFTSSRHSGLLYFAPARKVIYFYGKRDGGVIHSDSSWETRLLEKLLDSLKGNIKQGIEQYAEYADKHKVSEGLIVNCVYFKKSAGVILRKAFSYPW